MELFNQPEVVDKYLLNHSSPEDPVLAELTRHTYLKEVHPRMISGHIMGGFLQLFSQLISPSRILEIGTFTGYSAICLAKGLKSGGQLTTIEINDEFRETAILYFEKAGVLNQIKLLNGDALKIIPSLDETFDVVFIDANKDDYQEYYQLVFDKVSSGGYIITDNVLWGGKVLEDPTPDPTTSIIQQFNRMVTDDQRVENLLLPIRDGIMVIKKL